MRQRKFYDDLMSIGRGLTVNALENSTTSALIGIYLRTQTIISKPSTIYILAEVYIQYVKKFIVFDGRASRPCALLPLTTIIVITHRKCINACDGARVYQVRAA